MSCFFLFALNYVLHLRTDFYCKVPNCSCTNSTVLEHKALLLDRTTWICGNPPRTGNDLCNSAIVVVRNRADAFHYCYATLAFGDCLAFGSLRDHNTRSTYKMHYFHCFCGTHRDFTFSGACDIVSLQDGRPHYLTVYAWLLHHFLNIWQNRLRIWVYLSWPVLPASIWRCTLSCFVNFNSFTGRLCT